MEILRFILVEVLVFAAVYLGVWVMVPLLAAAGLEHSVGKYVKGENASFDPLYRFTTPERLAQVAWGVALLAGGIAVSALLFVQANNPILLLVMGLVAGAGAFQMPRLIVQAKIRRRNELFQRRLVDVTLGLANGLRSGAAPPQALVAVTRDVGGPVGEEFNLLLHEHHHFGIGLPECLERLGKRMPGEELLLLITAMRLTLQSGGSLADVLDKITDTIRQRVEFQEKLRTLTAQGRFEAIAMASAPLAAFLILCSIDSSLMKPLVTTPAGWTALGVVAVMETIGFLWIRKIVNVEA